MAELWNGIPLLDDSDKPEDIIPPGEGTGAIPRDYSVQPEEMFASPTEMSVFTPSEIEARIKEQTEQQSSLMHLYQRKLAAGEFKWLLQGSVGYCWSHSVTHAVMMDRLKRNLPYVPLSAYAIAATIKRGADQGGWCGLAAQFARERGIPSQALWPQGDRRYQWYDTPEVWADAAKYRTTEDWMDLARPAWDKQLSRAQLNTQLVLNNPCPRDKMRWAHSTCAIALVIVEAGRLGEVHINSWPDGADRRQKDGLLIMTGSWLDIDRNDGALSITSTTAG